MTSAKQEMGNAAMYGGTAATAEMSNTCGCSSTGRSTPVLLTRKKGVGPRYTIPLQPSTLSTTTRRLKGSVRALHDTSSVRDNHVTTTKTPMIAQPTIADVSSRHGAPQQHDATRQPHTADTPPTAHSARRKSRRQVQRTSPPGGTDLAASPLPASRMRCDTSQLTLTRRNMPLRCG